jgi:cytochrome oxidase assembly protein ShyY1
VYRVLLRPRWLALFVAVALLAALFIGLGNWQLSRLETRRAHNAIIQANIDGPARQVADVLVPSQPVEPGAEWQPVTATGQYDVEHQLLVRYRPLQGEPGFEILTPLVTSDGATLLVDRGWVPSGGSANEPKNVPAPPGGEVTVTGRLRQSEQGKANQIRPETGQVRFVNVPRIADWLGQPTYGGYLELTEQVPAAGDEPHLLPRPELDEGPHLGYAIQWFLFALIAVVGVALLAYDESHGGRLRERIRHSR